MSRLNIQMGQRMPRLLALYATALKRMRLHTFSQQQALLMCLLLRLTGMACWLANMYPYNIFLPVPCTPTKKTQNGTDHRHALHHQLKLPLFATNNAKATVAALRCGFLMHVMPWSHAIILLASYIRYSVNAELNHSVLNIWCQHPRVVHPPYISGEDEPQHKLDLTVFVPYI